MRETGELDDKEFNRVVSTASRQHADAINPLPKSPPTESDGLTSPTEGR
jgi:hypothetical protein